jgi:hypothetical protein
MTGKLAPVCCVLLLAATGSTWAEDRSNQCVFDFGEVPAKLYPARLAEIDGKNNLAPSKIAFWLDPGDHTIVVTAIIDDSMGVGTIDMDRHTDPGKVTIGCKAGVRYRIAAQALDERGKWQPVIWKEEPL